MRLLIIDNYDSFTFNLYHGLAPYFREIAVLRNDNLTLKEITDFDAMVISPGPGLPSEAGMMMEVLVRFMDSKPILGICLGHQAIAEVLGGQLVNLEQVIHGKSRRVIVQKAEDPVFSGINNSFDAGRYHSWVVDIESLPACLHVTAIDEHGYVMSIKHRELPVWGLQFHPESILTPCGPTILRNWAMEVISKQTKF